ncbi:MAG: nuclear transport factor 2 family protein [Bacteroidetes bacterium]|nr:nuclear transport factor 2 family protein [Bacteroidota bacterium]
MWKTELMAADSAFSAMSEREGSVAAFYAWIAEDGRALPQQGYPRAHDDFRRMLELQPESEQPTSLRWKPLMADVAASGDLGYTHGRYRFARLDAGGDSSFIHGYYVTVWKRQVDGSWKFVMDAGNEAAPEVP